MGGGQSRFWEAIASLQPTYDDSESPPLYGQWPTNPSTTDRNKDPIPVPDYEEFRKPLRQSTVAVLLFLVDADEPQLVHMPYDVMLNAADLGYSDETVYWEYKKRTGISQYIPGDLQMTFVTEQRQSDAVTHAGDTGGSKADKPPQSLTKSLGRVLEVLHPWYDHDSAESDAPRPNRCIARLIQRYSEEQHRSRVGHGGRGGQGRGRGHIGRGEGRELGDDGRVPDSDGASHNPGYDTKCPWYGNVLVTRVLDVTTACSGTSEIAEEFDDAHLEEDLAPMISFFYSLGGVLPNEFQVIKSPQKDLGLRKILGPGLRLWKHDLCRLPTEPVPIKVTNRVRY